MYMYYMFAASKISRNYGRKTERSGDRVRLDWRAGDRITHVLHATKKHTLRCNNISQHCESCVIYYYAERVSYVIRRRRGFLIFRGRQIPFSCGTHRFAKYTHARAWPGGGSCLATTPTSAFFFTTTITGTSVGEND